jgi:hypothetical protein
VTLVGVGMAVFVFVLTHDLSLMPQ